MLSRWFRTWLPGVLRPFVRWLMKIGVTPNGLTLANLVMSAFAGLLVALGWLVPAALAVALEGMFDSLDGMLARESGHDSPRGEFLDSICDHYGDFAIHLGIAYWGLVRGFDGLVLLTLVSLFGSVAGSHIRAKGDAVGVETKGVGFFTRMERTLVLFIGLLTGWMVPALAVLAVGVNLSAAQRFFAVIRSNQARETGLHHKTIKDQ